MGDTEHDIDNIIYSGHWLDVAEKLPDQSAQLVVTSPPYYKMRTYSTDNKDAVMWSDGWCGALGHEPMPDLYIAHLVECFHPLQRVLRDDGILWININDSRVGSMGGKGDSRERTGLGAKVADYYKGAYPGMIKGMHPTELIGIPHTFVAAMRQDGWLWRDEIIWHISNIKPESVRDRGTRDFEYVFMFVKPRRSPRYWIHPHKPGVRKKPPADHIWIHRETGETITKDPHNKGTWKRKNLWEGRRYLYMLDAIREPYTEPLDRWGGDKLDAKEEQGQWDKGTGQQLYRDRNMRPNPLGRQRRTVWSIPTRPFSGKHYAAYPPDLVRLIIQVASSPKACPHCGAPWIEVFEQQGYRRVSGAGTKTLDALGALDAERDLRTSIFTTKKMRNMVPANWWPTCSCEDNDGSVASVVLDPFCGAGTTLMVADEEGRQYVGCDILHKYAEMSAKRVMDRRHAEEIDTPNTEPRIITLNPGTSMTHIINVGKEEDMTRTDTGAIHINAPIVPPGPEFHAGDMSIKQILSDYVLHEKDIQKHSEDDGFVVRHISAQSHLVDEIRRRGGEDAVIAAKVYFLTQAHPEYFSPDTRKNLLRATIMTCKGE